MTVASETDYVNADEDDVPSLIIPIKSSSNGDHDLFIEIFPEELSETSMAVVRQVLRDERAGGSVWAQAAFMYMHQKQARDAAALLEEACEKITADDAQNKNLRVQLLAAAGIAHLASSVNANSQTINQDNEKLYQLADQRFTQAGKIDTFFPMTWIGRGMLNLKKEKYEQGKFFFETTLKQCGPVLPALLGLGAVLYGQQDYAGSQAKYSEAIRRYGSVRHPHAAAMRVGFGLACYQLGQVDRAKAAFARALEINSECVEAMVGSAVLDMAGLDESAKDFSTRIERAIKLMSMANLLDHANAMVQNHLANHYFWKWTPVTGTVQVTQGSVVVKASQQIPLDAAEPIRIGTRFETTVREPVVEEDDEEGTTFTINTPWNQETTAGLKVWKKDYERVFALAKGAFGSTRVKEIQAESLFFLARVYHVREDNDNAFKFYKKACELYPALAPARFGLAQTLIVKEEYAEAITQLKELLTTSSKATDALALLGLLEVQSGINLEEGLGFLRKAIELDPLNPELVILEAMALQQHRSNFPKSLEKYKKAVSLMQREGIPVPAHIYTNIGVLCQETRKFDEALEMYKQALAALDDAVEASKPALENLGIEGGRIRHPDNDVFFGFVETSVRVEVCEEEEEGKYKTVKIVAPEDADETTVLVGEHIRLGESFATSVTSVKTLEGAILLELADACAPPDNEDKENNDGDKKGTYQVYVKRENRLLDIPGATTIAFNIARLHEATGRILGAIEIHKAITKRNPAYVNCYLRLACIAVDSGALKECSEWLKIAAASSPGNAEVLTLIGNLHLSLCDWKPAQDVFDGLMGKKIPSVEAYAALSMGNIYFENLNISEQKYAKHLQYASDYYKKILAKDPLNAYAANGLGTILAEKAEIFKAKEAFNRVREVSEDTIADALLNLGHIFLAQKKHPEALQMYQNYMKRVEDVATPTTSKSRVDDLVDVLLYIAFAYFDWARHTELFNDTNAAPADERYKHAMKHLVLALEKKSQKKEVILKYNLCMTKLQAANCVLQKLTRNIPRTVEEVEEALKGLEESLVVVEEILKEKEQGARIVIKTSTLQDFLKHCKANIVSAQSHLEDERKRAEEEAQEREIRRLAAIAAQKEEEIKAAIRKQEDAKKQEERDQKADAKMRKVEALRYGWQQEQEAAQQAEEKKKKKRTALDDFIVEDDPEGDTRPGGLFEESDDESGSKGKGEEKKEKAVEKPSKKAKPSRSDLFGDSDNDDSDAEPLAKKATPSKSELFGESDEDTEDGEVRASKKSKDKPEKKKAKKKDNKSDDSGDELLGDGGESQKNTTTSKELFGDSDEDEESDEELVKPDAKREADGKDDGQPKKKRRVLDDEE